MQLLNLLVINPSDSQQTVVDAINFNFDQILAMGGGSPGVAGYQGIQGIPGLQGIHGIQGPAGTPGSLRHSNADLRSRGAAVGWQPRA